MWQPMFRSGKSSAQCTNYGEVTSKILDEKEPSFSCFGLSIKLLFHNSSLPAKTQRKL